MVRQLLTGILLGSVAAALNAQPLFSPGVLVAYEQPEAVVTGDLNNDGLADIITANKISRDVSIWLSQPGRRFSEPETIHFLTFYNEFGTPAIGDVDGDGWADVVIPEPYGQRVSVWINDGTGHVAPAPFDTIPTGPWPRRVVLIDFDHDGDLDYVIAGDGSVSLRLNRGDGLPTQGAFAFPIDDELNALVVADFTGDGLFDIATASQMTGFAYLIINLGDSFSAPYAIHPSGFGMQFGNGFGDLVAIDVDRNGVLDLVGTAEGTTDLTLAFIRSDGSAHHLVQTVVLDVSPNRGGQRMAVGDIDLDGRDDLLIASASPELVWFEPKISSPIEPHRLRGSSYTKAVAIDDVDGDGFTDVVAASYYTDSVRVIYGAEDGLVTEEHRDLEVGSWIAKIDRCDVNLDGVPDLVLGTDYSGRGVFIDGATGVEQTLWQVNDFDLGDLNGDGYPDLVFNTYSSWGWSYFVPGEGFGTPTYRSGSTLGIAIGQVDGMGFGDVIMGGGFQPNLRVFINDGAGGFEDVVETPAIPNIVANLLVDLDGDEDLDVIVLSRSYQMAMLYNNGTGGFSDPLIRPLMNNIVEEAADNKLLMADVTGDGEDDLVVLGYQGITLLAGDGLGGFGEESIIIEGSSGRSLEAGDLDLDGDLDLVVTRQQTDAVGVFLNAGGGSTWQGPFWFGAGPEPKGLELFDDNGDGVLDLLAGCRGKLTVTYGLAGQWCSGDATSDAVVDLDDLQAVLFWFGQVVVRPEQGDVDYDGDVDLDDLQIVLFAFGTQCSVSTQAGAGYDNGR